MSKEFVVETYLFCENCLEDTMHRALYKDGEIVKLTCLQCDNEIMLNRPAQRIKKERGFSKFITKFLVFKS